MKNKTMKILGIVAVVLFVLMAIMPAVTADTTRTITCPSLLGSRRLKVAEEKLVISIQWSDTLKIKIWRLVDGTYQIDILRRSFYHSGKWHYTFLVFSIYLETALQVADFLLTFTISEDCETPTIKWTEQ